jgi:hypothetical protein
MPDVNRRPRFLEKDAERPMDDRDAATSLMQTGGGDFRKRGVDRSCDPESFQVAGGSPI